MSAETLRRAAAIVGERGLAKGRYQDDDGRVCVEGAIALAGGCQSPYTYTLVHNEFAHMHDLHDNKSVVLWNDAPERTADEVIAALEAAAARLEAT